MPTNAQEQIDKFTEFIEANYKEQIQEIISTNKKSVFISFKDLAEFDHELAEELLNEPEELLKAAELSLERLDLPNSIKVRFNTLPPSQTLPIRDIRSEHLNKLVVIEGVVKQASDVRPQVVSAKFECPSCGNTITILQIEEKFREPSRCSCGRRGFFRLLSKELEDTQRLIIEESLDSLEGGEQPKKLAVFLKRDLVEPKMEKRTTPGSKVMIIGIVREIQLPAKSGGHLTRYDLMIDVNNIEPIEETYEEVEIKKEDEDKIVNLSKDPMLFEKLINSIAPSVYGHEAIKEALVLQLVGGVKKTKEDNTPTRGDMHVLLVGDPGAAKSTLLVSVSKVAPKGRFVSGKSASAAGITATVVKDEFLRGWALEAGAMVLANKGIAIIDELDKMSKEDSGALHEAMEQQRISIAKANIQATLKAETTVLAAANPKLGRFNRQIPIPNQIDLPPTLINRFDLIFPVTDVPNKEKDEKIASHILKLHQTPKEITPEIKTELFKKYLAYAKQRIKPKLSDQALEEIKSFYVDLRNQGQNEEESQRSIPISARQLEALVRLAEASAKLRLSETVTRTDAKRAINLLRYCLMQVGFDYETGRFDIDRMTTGITASKRNKVMVLRELISDLESKGNKTIDINIIATEAAARGIKKEEMEDIIELLKKSGEIFEPRRNFIQKVS